MNINEKKRLRAESLKNIEEIMLDSKFKLQHLYRIKKFLGKGGFATVLLVRPKHERRMIAIKVGFDSNT